MQQAALTFIGNKTFDLFSILMHKERFSDITDCIRDFSIADSIKVNGEVLTGLDIRTYKARPGLHDINHNKKLILIARLDDQRCTLRVEPHGEFIDKEIEITITVRRGNENIG